MILNCKPGQMAIKIRANPTDHIPLGAIVKCVQLHDASTTIDLANNVIHYPIWDVEWNDQAQNPANGHDWAVQDRFLKPLPELGNDEEDLYAVDKPIEETV